MKRFLTMLATGSLILAFGFSTGFAQEEEDQSDPATPIEIYACKYNEGMGPADLDAAAAKWNAWADKRELNSYSAWTLVPFYSGPEQDFDFLWLGGAKSAAALGRAQEDWLANGGKIQEQFNAVSTCDGHSNFASVKFKTPPERKNPSRVVVSFSDCNMSDGMSFDDIAPALSAWADYREGHGSTSGMWVLFPAYGQGGEEFDFKFIASWGNLEEQGADWDQYSAGGYAKADELFAGKLDCDASRVYITTNRRMAADDGE
ncbi:MAG: hypothetical protein OES10_05310 [Gammaproteobacteria bacterium]|nr:hypothetical protein [Gammaproteobacteria bacterium]MDH3750228.1 hypothetical protein [Gammaproteobacteria bacterium]